MQVRDAILARRSIKAYDPSQKMSDAEFKQLMDLAVLTPSSFNIQHWRFVRVTDAAQREQIKAAAWNQQQIADASEVLVICADVKAWEKSPAQYWEGAAPETQKLMADMLTNFYQGREWIQRDEALRSVGMIAQTIMLEAQEMGYDSGPMIGFDQDAVGKIINLPADYLIGMIVVIGKRAKDPYPRVGKLSSEKVVVTNKF